MADTLPVSDPESPPGWVVRQLFRVGSVQGEGGPAFGQVRGVELDDEGNLYVLDGQARVVQVFGSDGKVQRTLGGRGGGPGEFRDPTGLLTTSDGRLWVFDPAGTRYTAFGPGGALEGTYRRAFSAGWGTYWEAVEVEGGALYEPTTIRRAGSEEIVPVFLALRPGDGAMVPEDTVPRSPSPDRPTWYVAPIRGASGPVMSGRVPVPFTPESRERLDPRGGYWVGTTGAPRFTRIAWAGDTVQVIEKVHAELRRVTARDRDLAVGELTERFGEALRPDLSQLPEVMPYWQEFWVDSSGRLWVERFRPPGTPADQPHEWEIYAAEGDYLGKLRLALAGRPAPVLRNGRLAGVVRDETDVDHVVVFQLMTRESSR